MAYFAQDAYGGTQTSAVAGAKGTDTVISAGAGRLCKVIVTVTGANPMQIYDNASAGSGVIVGQLPASPAVGTIFVFDSPCANGITVKGSGTNPGVTICFS